MRSIALDGLTSCTRCWMLGLRQKHSLAAGNGRFWLRRRPKSNQPLQLSHVQRFVQSMILPMVRLMPKTQPSEAVDECGMSSHLCDFPALSHNYLYPAFTGAC
jgi:hypothetical protein